MRQEGKSMQAVRTNAGSAAKASLAPSPRFCRGQIVVTDLIVSIAIFVILIVIAYQAWNQQIDNLGTWRSQANAQDALERGLDSLTRSGGTPSNWAALGLDPTRNETISVGCAQSYGELDPFRLERVASFLNRSNETANDTRTKMGLGPYMMDASVRYLNGTQIMHLGNATGAGGMVSASGQRMAMYRGVPVLVRMSLWRYDYP